MELHIVCLRNLEGCEEVFSNCSNAIFLRSDSDMSSNQGSTYSSGNCIYEYFNPFKHTHWAIKSCLVCNMSSLPYYSRLKFLHAHLQNRHKYLPNHELHQVSTWIPQCLPCAFWPIEASNSYAGGLKDEVCFRVSHVETIPRMQFLCTWHKSEGGSCFGLQDSNVICGF